MKIESDRSVGYELATIAGCRDQGQLRAYLKESGLLCSRSSVSLRDGLNRLEALNAKWLETPSMARADPSAEIAARYAPLLDESAEALAGAWRSHCARTQDGVDLKELCIDEETRALNRLAPRVPVIRMKILEVARSELAPRGAGEELGAFRDRVIDAAADSLVVVLYGELAGDRRFIREALAAGALASAAVWRPMVPAFERWAENRSPDETAVGWNVTVRGVSHFSRKLQNFNLLVANSILDCMQVFWREGIPPLRISGTIKPSVRMRESFLGFLESQDWETQKDFQNSIVPDWVESLSMNGEGRFGCPAGKAVARAGLSFIGEFGSIIQEMLETELLTGMGIRVERG